MARPADSPGKPRRNVVTVRLTDEGLAALDTLVRAEATTRAEYIRTLLAAANGKART